VRSLWTTHGAISSPREPTRAYRVELRDFQPHGIETRIFQNGVLLTACRFTVRALAVVWAEQKRAEILKVGA
jgi:hypothetical protein